VLGWEEILALMADAPEVIAEFYPEHVDHLPEVVEALRVLPLLKTKLATLVDRLDANPLCQRSCRPDRIGKLGGAGHWHWPDLGSNHTKGDRFYPLR